MGIGNVEKVLKMNLRLFGADEEDEKEDELSLEELEDLLDDEDDDDLEDDEPEKEERKFTQAELDAIIKERLERERKKPKEESELERFVREQAAKNNMKPDEYIEKIRTAERMKVLEERAKATGEDLETVLLKEQVEAAKAAEKKREAEEQAAKQQQAHWEEMVAELAEKYPKLDLEKLDKNEQFIKFLRNSNPALRLVEVYENFAELTGKAAEAGMKRASSRGERSTGKDDGSAGGEELALTKTELRLCKENGISPKKFLEDKERFRKMS